MKFLRLSLYAVLLLTISIAAHSQTSFTSVRGLVTDNSGAVIENAKITLENKAVGYVDSRTSDSKGQYQFLQLQPGTYQITAEANGFSKINRTAQLLVNQPATLNFSLGVQGAETTVSVTADAPLLNATDATIGNAINNQEIQALPSEGRNVPDLLSLQPGVLYLGRNVDKDGDSRSGAVAGARSDQGNVTLDGLDNNDQTNGYAFTGILRTTLDSTQEYRVTTVNSNADGGRSSGAQVSIVTKSGTNNLHGSLYEYHRPSFTVANDWFNKQSQKKAGLPNVPGKLIRNTFGGTIGGPILKDKLFFFFNYEGQRTAENQQVTRTVPTAAFRAGNLSYEYEDANKNTAVQTMNSGQIAAVDTDCSANGTCPWGAGVNPNIVNTLKQYPVNNGFTTGDGYNMGSFTFSSPAPASLNTTIFKIDYSPNDRQRIFVRGNLQKDVTAGPEQFPGQPASYSIRDNTKGLAGGHTWTLSPNIVNDVRYGYIRQGYSDRGIGSGEYVNIRFLDTPTAQTRTSIVHVPVHNIVDNLTWTKGNHTVQFGGNWRGIQNERSTDANSYASASTNPYWLSTNGFPDPTTIGLPAVSDGYSNSYLVAMATILGTVPSLNTKYNYQVNPGGASGTLLSNGAFVSRKFKANEFEYYVQDSWRVRPNLTMTFGIRHTLLQTPYEANGQQVAPTVDTNAWYRKRQEYASRGEIYPDQILSFAPTGPKYNKPGYWAKQKLNIAPRFSLAYSPDAKTSIRVGAGMYFDHFGQGIVNSFDQMGSFGLGTSLTNQGNVFTVGNTPRYTGRQSLPNINNGSAPSNPSYPYTPEADAFLITWGIDNKLKTPYSEAFDLSVQRELPGGFLLETSYVGRLGRHLLQQLDLAQPVNYLDTKSGSDYFTAGAQLSKLVDQNGGDPDAIVPAIPYFENLFPYYAHDGKSATQNIYSEEWAPYRYTYGETTALADIDFYCSACTKSRFWQGQFSSLYSWASNGMSYYNAGQVVLRHPMRHGLQADFSYTLSKSIDMGSDTERTSSISSVGAFSAILNTWKPEQNRAVSDFDTRHLITANWVYKLPLGNGQLLLGSASHALNSAVGGWQFSGLARWSSGLPFSLLEPGYGTDWELESFAMRTGNGKVKIRKHLDSNGTPQVFDDPSSLNKGIRSTTGAVRLPYPGEAGERNVYRGDGYFNVDSGLTKEWKFWKEKNLRFSWEVFNVTNSVRFDTSPSYLSPTLTSGSLGNYSKTLTDHRVQQFSLRVDF